MQSIASGAAERRMRRGYKPHFSLVIFYEDFATGKKALKACLNLSDRTSRHACCTTAMWKLNMLQVSGLRNIATQDALDADVIIFSLHGLSGLPRKVKTWLQQCLARKRNHPNAVALILDSPALESGRLCAARSFLLKAARRAGIDWFSEMWSQPGVPSELNPTGQAAQLSLTTLTNLLHVKRVSVRSAPSLVR